MNQMKLISITIINNEVRIIVRKMIEFENSLFGDETNVNVYDIIDVEFWVNRIVLLPSIRPFSLERTVRMCEEYVKNDEFKRLFIKKAANSCYVLLYRLFQSGIISFSEIHQYLESDTSLVLCYYFRKEIKDFQNQICHKWSTEDFDESFFQNDEDIDKMINFGFLPSSIEYCLKYDDLDGFREIISYSSNSINWSPFEWSKKPPKNDILSFSGFFGSIHCFKHLLINGYSISNDIFNSIVCGGNTDLFHLFNFSSIDYSACIYYSIVFCRISMLIFAIENGAKNTIAYSYSNDSPLHIASKYGHLCIIDYLIRNSYDINGKNDNESTPLHIASQNGFRWVIESLVNNGAELNTVDEYQLTPLYYAAEYGNISCFECLKNNGADFSGHINGETYLHWAAAKGHLKTIMSLFPKWPDINEKNSNYLT